MDKNDDAALRRAADETVKSSDIGGGFDLDGFASEHHGLFRTCEAKRAGWQHWTIAQRLAEGRIARVHEGVYRFRGAPDTWDSRALAAVWAAPSQAGLSHHTAAHVFDLPGGSPYHPQLLCQRWKRAQHDGFHVHEFSGLVEDDLTVVRNIPVVVPELALLQIAGYEWSSVDHVETAIYRARRQGLVTNASVQEYLYRRARRGRPGIRRLRAALALSSAHARPTDSDMETKLLRTLRASGFPEPVLQFDLCDANGVFIARVDALLERWKILLEYDSREQHSDPVDQRRDERRRLWAMRYGYWTVPVHSEDLDSGGRELVAALRGLIAVLDARAA